ncbi:MAG: metallophosphoesterase family protein [Thermogutta sp.]
MSRISRRNVLAGTLAALGGSLWGRGGKAQAAAAIGPDNFRFVHLTDIHVQPELKAAEGLAACLQSVNKLDPKPDFIMTGGDLIMDALEQSAERSSSLFDLLKKVFADNTDIPVRHCMGNHDVFGWGRKHGVTSETSGYGKQMYCEKLGIERPYDAFDHRGWRFYVLDSVQPSESGLYQGGLDEEQVAWLRQDLDAKPADVPAVVVSHIPIITVTVLPNEANEGAFKIGAGSMCAGGQALASLFAEHNVRLALSGHTHMVDEVVYRGVKYVCDGAVSGRWWKGSNRGFPEGFGILDLNAESGAQFSYQTYGWQAEGQS